MKNNMKWFPKFLFSTKSLIASAAIVAVGAASTLMGELVAAPPVVQQKSANSSEQMIRDVLDGKELGPVGDGVLEDIIGVIRGRGSILDGSILDDRDDGDRQADDRQRHHKGDGDVKSHPSSDRIAAIHRRALAAEQLLRAARLLVSVGGNDAQADLVRQMRSEAARLLNIQPHGEPPLDHPALLVDPVERKSRPAGQRKSGAGKARRIETE